MSEPLPVGTPAPDFQAAASDGRIHRLADELRDAHLLLIFYPGNNTPG